MRTNWAQTAAGTDVELLPDYQPSVGAVYGMLKHLAGKEFGDPQKISEVILDLAQRDTLPNHLLLGSDASSSSAWRKPRTKAAAEWEQVSRSTDFDGSDVSVFTGGAIE